MTSERLFYAWVEVREWGEPDREQRIGPFHAETADELRDVLERDGEIVLSVALAEEAPR